MSESAHLQHSIWHWRKEGPLHYLGLFASDRKTPLTNSVNEGGLLAHIIKSPKIDRLQTSLSSQFKQSCQEGHLILQGISPPSTLHQQLQVAKWQQHSKTSQRHITPSRVAGSFTSLRIHHFWQKLGNLPIPESNSVATGMEHIHNLKLTRPSPSHTPFSEMRLIPWAGVKFLLYPYGRRWVVDVGRGNRQIPMTPFLSMLFSFPNPFSRRHMNVGNSYLGVCTLFDCFQMRVLQVNNRVACCLWPFLQGKQIFILLLFDSFSHQFIILFTHLLIQYIFMCQMLCFSFHVFF